MGLFSSWSAEHNEEPRSGKMMAGLISSFRGRTLKRLCAEGRGVSISYFILCRIRCISQLEAGLVTNSLDPKGAHCVVAALKQRLKQSKESFARIVSSAEKSFEPNTLSRSAGSTSQTFNSSVLAAYEMRPSLGQIGGRGRPAQGKSVFKTTEQVNGFAP